MAAVHADTLTIAYIAAMKTSVRRTKDIATAQTSR
jgi:hypothetical protein